MTISAQPVRRALLLALAVAAMYALAASFATPARALDDTKPTPTCAGVDFTDPKGDAAVDVSPLTGVSLPLLPATDNMDITGGFFKYDADSSGTAALTANIQIANLNKDIPSGASGVTWYYFWTVADQLYFVEADLDSAGATTFSYGLQDPNTGVLTGQGEAKGKFFEGEDGVIQIAVPQAPTKATDGTKLLTPYASSRAAFSIPDNPVQNLSYIPTADNGPDSQAGKAYTVAQCPSSAPAPATQTPGTGTTPATSSGVLPVRLVTSSAKAAKGKKGKSLSFKLKSTEEITSITATFKKGSTSYGSGKLAKVNGNGTLKVKLKKSLKKGTYKLQLKGSTAAGKAKATFSVKVR
jgi:hypothetical protein